MTGRPTAIAASSPQRRRQALGSPDPERLLRRYRKAVVAEMEAALAGRSLALYDMMRYHLGLVGTGEGRAPQAGKMVRPTFCLLSCEAVGGDRQQALPAAAAIELIHNFTLIHDDIEDGSHVRHGRDTVWRVWGEPQAINAGDGMFVLAHLAVYRLIDVGVPATLALEAARLLDEACLALCEGQHLDLEFETRLDVGVEEYLTMISGKTAALMSAATAVGALLGSASRGVVNSFREFGRCLGLAFQVQDDVLGIWGDTALTGKPAGDDIAARKKSYPVVHALGHASEEDRRLLRRIYSGDTVEPGRVGDVLAVLERSGARARSEEAVARHVEHALCALAALQGPGLAPARQRELEALALYLVHRSR